MDDDGSGSDEKPRKTDSFPTKKKGKKTSQYRRCKKKKTVARRRRRSGSRRLNPSAVDEQGTYSARVVINERGAD